LPFLVNAVHGQQDTQTLVDRVAVPTREVAELAANVAATLFVPLLYSAAGGEKALQRDTRVTADRL
jgi:hypothetical protein